MDLGLIFGVVATWVLIFWALVAGGQIGIYVDIPSVILVCGTSFTIMFFAFPTGNVKQLIKVVKRAFASDNRKIDQLIEELVSYAEIARRDGILSLENATRNMNDPFIVRGIQDVRDSECP